MKTKEDKYYWLWITIGEYAKTATPKQLNRVINNTIKLLTK